METNLLLEISKFTIIIGAIWAIIQFWSANEFKKAQYLSELWRKFYSTDEFVEIFDLLDRDDLENFQKIDSKKLFKYLAFLEEIVIFRNTRFYHIYKLKDKSLINLFQFHFYNLYINENSKVRVEFWKKINFISKNAQFNLDDELSKYYWKQQYQFAIACSKTISKFNN